MGITPSRPRGSDSYAAKVDLFVLNSVVDGRVG